MIRPGENIFSENEYVIQPVVHDLLLEHESDDSLSTGNIIDIATISPDDPYGKFDFSIDKVVNSSQNLIEKTVATNDHQNSIAIAVELPSSDIFIDMFSYDTSVDSPHDSIESLALSLDVDISSIHHLIGKEVQIVRENERWVICEHRNTLPVKVSVTRSDFLNPLAIAGLLIPLSALIGWHTTYPIEITTLVGITTAALLYSGLLYMTLAVKRDHPLPGVLKRMFMPDYTDNHGIIEPSEDITEVHNGEFRRLITLADEDEHDSARAVLYNLAVVVNIPPVGEKTIPLPAPTSAWTQTTIKEFVYRLSSSVEELDRAQGKSIPLKRVDDRIIIDTARLQLDEPTRKQKYAERIADSYVEFINSAFDVGARDTIFS